MELKKQINYSKHNNKYHRLVETWITYLKWEKIKILITTRENKTTHKLNIKLWREELNKKGEKQTAMNNTIHFALEMNINW